MMDDRIVRGNFESQGFSLGDKRAIALHDWMIELGRPATVDEMNAEMERLKRIMPAPEDVSPDDRKIVSTPEWDALNAFDAENDVEPTRAIAERIASKYGRGFTDPLVDDISHAIEDARELGARRGPLEAAAKGS